MVINRNLWIFALELTSLRMNRIGVFCSASSNIDAIYSDNAQLFGEWLGKNNKTLVYGGVNRGLMEVIGKTAHRYGGEVIGVIPKKLQEHASEYLDQRIITEGLSDRKETILQYSDILVAFPGGIGTLDEVFHVLAGKYIGAHNKKVIFYNINGHYSSLLTCLAEYKRNGFVGTDLSSLYEVANTDSELRTLLK